MSSIDRPCHALKAEKTLAVPRHVIFFDCESHMSKTQTGDTEHILRLGWACYYRRAEFNRPAVKKWLEFRDPDSFWCFVDANCRTKNKLWVIAHNLSFDFKVVEGFRYLRRLGFKCKFFHSSGATTLIKVTQRGKSIMFVDSLNWFKESVEKLGQRLGIPKLKIDFETADDFELSIYCKRDVEILVEIFEHLVRFLQANRISRLCYTIGSTAMAAFLFRHYNTPIYIHNNEQALQLERASYKGGRTECFYIGGLSDGPFYVVDVNSLYPFVMRNHNYPVKYAKIAHNVSRSDLGVYLQSMASVATVTLTTDSPLYAVRGERTTFPTGTFTTTITTPDLLTALAGGHISRVSTAVFYESAPIFKSYVDRFYGIRQEFARAENPVFEHFCKILLNSLYGKFGQKADDWCKIGDAPLEPDRVEDIIDADSGRRRKLRYLLGEVFECVGSGESYNSFPAIAAHVTAYARAYLWHLIVTAGRENVYYCDTDSLFVNSRGLDNLSDYLDDNELGKLKIEYQTSTLSIKGLKDYETQDKTVLKGIKKDSTLVRDSTYSVEHWPTLQGTLRVSSALPYTTRRLTKTLNRRYTKGNVTHSGQVEPFVLDGLVEALP